MSTNFYKWRRKMIMIGEFLWPPDKGTDIGKAFLEAPSLPDYIKVRGPYLSGILGKGTRSISIFEFDASKVEDANKAIFQRYVPYMRVQGFTYEIKIWGEVQEALELFGLA
jgi:hypothetical protein